MRCRICSSGLVETVGTLSPYADYATDVYDCSNCGNRFVPHDEGVYEKLHAAEWSSYKAHVDYAQTCKAFISRGDIVGLEQFLRRSRTYRFVIESVQRLPRPVNLLEIGCSRGAVASLFIAQGDAFLGVDVAPTAVESARRDFGDHFVVLGSEEIERRAPFDCIYHTGTIGCVADPCAFTRSALGLLKRGGILVFNSPDVDTCRRMGQLWCTGTAPPDLVTLFREDFWRKWFSEEVDVRVEHEVGDGVYNLALTLQRCLGSADLELISSGLLESRANGCSGSIESGASRLLKWLRALPLPARLALRLLAGFPGLPKYRTNYGMYVMMQKR